MVAMVHGLAALHDRLVTIDYQQLPRAPAFPNCSPVTDLTPTQAEPPYLRGLNAPQREAVLTVDGPVLVLAGAGTGKTAALTRRLAHILFTRKAYPSEILSVTFTNKAAREMRHRVGQLVGDAVEGMPWLGTFHSIGAKMLRRHAELVGLQSNFTILDTDDQKRLLFLQWRPGLAGPKTAQPPARSKPDQIGQAVEDRRAHARSVEGLQSDQQIARVRDGRPSEETFQILLWLTARYLCG